MKRSVTIQNFIRRFLFLFVLLVSTTAFAQNDTLLDLYWLIGQSNMAGRGEINDEFKKEGSDSVLMLNKEGNWMKASHPLHFDKPSVAGVGPGLRFGLEMAKTSTHKIGLIPCAVGGTSINAWKPGGYDKATDTHPYDEDLMRLKTTTRYGKLKGVIWLQGESDSDSAKSIGYLKKLQELITLIRTTIDDAQLPFVAGAIGHFKPQYKNINDQLEKLPAAVPYTITVSSDGLIDKGDKTHFNAASADEYGRRFAKGMQALLSKK